MIYAYVSDGDGRTKDRPAVIVSRDEENDAGEDLFVIAITGAIEQPCPLYHVIVPGLDKPSVAKCNWFRKIKQNKVIRSCGYLDDDLMETIVDRFLEIFGDPTFDDWVGPPADLARD
jgi:mRNA-degrading endonuclease toxin of MazEF toxin-antitoxin module